jgi:hypothetical protein
MRYVSVPIAAFSDAVSEAVDGVDYWEGAEGREDKAEAKETLLNALARVVEAFDEIVEEDGEVGGINADGSDVLSPEEKAEQAEADRIAHVAVAGCLEDNMQASLQAVTIGLEELQQRQVALAADYLYKQHLYAGEKPIEDE